jgi:hypothetical protein
VLLEQLRAPRQLQLEEPCQRLALPQAPRQAQLEEPYQRVVLRLEEPCQRLVLPRALPLAPRQIWLTKL